MSPSTRWWKVCLLLTLAACLGYPASSAAQPGLDGINEFYTSAGISQPISPSRFKSFWETGNHMSVGVGIEKANVFVLRFGLRYNTFVLDTAAVRNAEPFTEEITFPASTRYFLLGTTCDLLVSVPTPIPRLSPFVSVGLTLYYTNLADLGINAGPTTSDFSKSGQAGGAMNVGVGLSHAVTTDVETFLEYELVGGFLGGDKKVFTPLSLGLAIRI